MKRTIIISLAALFSLYVQAQYKVGDIYNKDGVKGFVALVDESGYHGLLLSLDECDEDWTLDKDLNFETAAFHEDDGMKNMEAIKKYIAENGKSWDDFPTHKWAQSLGEKWYIPSKNELLDIWKSMNGGTFEFNKKSAKIWNTYNKTIKKADGVQFKTTYWHGSGRGYIIMGMVSSTESEGGKIWAVYPVGSRILLDNPIFKPQALIEAVEVDKNKLPKRKKDFKMTGDTSYKYATRAVCRF